ncbi:hypothetical protein C8A01DRAFT_41869, partial [Parachaetomium inaequale]
MDIVRSTTLIQLSLQTTSLPASVGERTAAAALQAGRYLYAGRQFAVGLARLQLEVFGTVEKPPGVDPSMAVNFWDQPQYKALKALCGGIKFRSSGHTSLSKLGFGLILGMSGVLVLLSFADVVSGKPSTYNPPSSFVAARDQYFFMATYYMYFPLLACEVKCGAAALEIADRQNAYSMTLAVRGIVELFRAVKLFAFAKASPTFFAKK